MKPAFVRSLAALGALLLAACGSDTPPPEPREQDRALERAIQAPQDKARAVEDEVLKARQEQDARVEEQGGGA